MEQEPDQLTQFIGGVIGNGKSHDKLGTLHLDPLFGKRGKMVRFGIKVELVIGKHGQTLDAANGQYHFLPNTFCSMLLSVDYLWQKTPSLRDPLAAFRIPMR